MKDSISEYCQSLKDELLSKKRRSEILDSTETTGHHREDLVKVVLRELVPESVKILNNGEVYDSFGNSTGELDIIIYDPQWTLSHHAEGHMKRIPVEACLAVISVKSNLKHQSDKDGKMKGIRNELNKCARLKRCWPALRDIHQSILDPPNVMPGIVSLQAANLHAHVFPRFYIFGYDGSALPTLYRHISEHPEIRTTQALKPKGKIQVTNLLFVPDLICVAGKGLIYRNDGFFFNPGKISLRKILKEPLDDFLKIIETEEAEFTLFAGHLREATNTYLRNWKLGKLGFVFNPGRYHLSEKESI